MLRLLTKAAFYRPSKANLNSVANPNSGGNTKNIPIALPVLPDVSLSRTIKQDSKNCDAYHQLCDWSFGIAALMHPNYAQVLSLPMQLEMMLNPSFPFKILGLVHLSNDIEVVFLPDQSCDLLLKTFFGRVLKHPKGWVFELVTEAFVDNQLSVRGTSAYLSRQSKNELALSSQNVFPESVLFENASTQLLSSELDSLSCDLLTSKTLCFKTNIGRQYAKVSGDYNPIHLSQISAKLLGFKRAIAHGMYSKALCLSKLLSDKAVLEQCLLGNFAINTQFLQAIYLAQDCTLQSRLLKLNSKDDELEHDGEHQVIELCNIKASEPAKTIEGLSFGLNSYSGGQTREHLRGQVVFTKAS